MPLLTLSLLLLCPGPRPSGSPPSHPPPQPGKELVDSPITDQYSAGCPMWECPVFFTVDGIHVFKFSNQVPWGGRGGHSGWVGGHGVTEGGREGGWAGSWGGERGRIARILYITGSSCALSPTPPRPNPSCCPYQQGRTSAHPRGCTPHPHLHLQIQTRSQFGQDWYVLSDEPLAWDRAATETPTLGACRPVL